MGFDCKCFEDVAEDAVAIPVEGLHLKCMGELADVRSLHSVHAVHD